MKTPPLRYGFTAIWLHWVMALLLIALFIIGNTMDDFPAPIKFQLINLHKSFGIIALGLVFIRLVWRLFNPVPAPPASSTALEVVFAKVVSTLLYVLMFLIPLSGWLMSSAKGYSVRLFNQISLPDLIGESEKMAERFESMHELLAHILLILVVIHVLAALKHHFILKDGTLRRMLPRGRASDKKVS